MELVINFSGGKDSTAMLAWLCERYPDVPKHVVMADTGWEHPDAIEWSRGIVARFGLELQVVRAVWGDRADPLRKGEQKKLLDMALVRGMFPGMKERQCTSDLKRGPIMKWIRNNWKGRKAVIINCMGLRAEESSSRAKRPCLSPMLALSKRGREVWDWNPILGWTEVEVRTYLAARGLPLHTVYEHLRRFSCRVCIYMTDHDLRAVAKHDPAAIDIIATVEQEIGFTMFQRGAIRQLVQHKEH